MPEARPRGTLETVFKYTPYDELRRLGLDAQTEARMRAHSPSSPACWWSMKCSRVRPRTGCCHPATFSLRSTANPCRSSSPWKTCWTITSAGGQGRGAEGDQTLRHALDVESLGAITADEYIEFGEAVVHTLSYQQARHYNLPIKGVYVANPGYVFGSAGIPHGALISSFNGKKMRRSRISSPPSETWRTAPAPRYVM